ncbi:hypothetical protein Tco_1190981 [Tanacetum coccineum]
MRRMSNSGGRFAKKTEAEKKSASSCSSGMKHVISECTESIITHQETNGKMNLDFAAVNRQRQEIISLSDAACKLCLE